MPIPAETVAATEIVRRGSASAGGPVKVGSTESGTAAETVRQFSVKKLILFGGCQLELKALDTKLLTETLRMQLGILVKFHRECHFDAGSPA